MEKSMENLYGRMGACYARNGKVIEGILERYARMYEEHWKEPLGAKAYQSIRMDMMALGLDLDCDLQVLLDSDDFSFLHDIEGTYRHLNRTNGEMNDCFVPRCCRGTSRKETNV